MKRYRWLSLLAMALALKAGAAPLQKSNIPADTQWMVHLDLDNFRNTKLGQYLGQEVLEQQLAKPKADLKQYTGFELDWRKIGSITAFGSDFQPGRQVDGVLLIKSELKLQEALDAFMAKLAVAGPANGGPLKKIEGNLANLYSVNNDVFVAFHSDKMVLLGKSKAQLEKAARVLNGQDANLGSSDTFAGYPQVPNAFFFLAVAESFNEGLHLPPQANILKMANGGRLVLSENNNLLRLQLALKAKSAEASQQMQQVVQGLLALVSMNQTDKPELMQLAKSTTVSANDNVVTVQIQFPVDEAISKITAGIQAKTTGAGSKPRAASASRDKESKSESTETVEK